MPPRPDSSDDRLGQRDAEVGAALRFTRAAVLAGLAVLLVAGVWARGCGPTIETAACGLPYRSVLALATPVLFAGAGLRAFWRTYRVWQARGTWWGWQGAGWFLLSLMVLAVIVVAPPILGPALVR